MNKLILSGVTLLIIASTQGWAQFEDDSKIFELSTDRPDQTESPNLLPSGTIQLETGFMVEGEQSNQTDVRAFTYNTTLVRIGLNENIELRLISEYVNTRTRDKFTDQTSFVKGFAPVAIGTKLKITDEHKFIPQIGFIAHITLPVGSEVLKPSYIAPDFRFSFEHTLNDHFSLGYNLGGEWGGEAAEATGIYTLVLGISISDKLGCFIESYGFVPEESANDHRLDAGFTFLLRNNIQLDVSAGIGLSEISPDNFISTGLSWRFPN